MADAKIEVSVPLFDRLVDRQLDLRREARPMRTLDRRGLKESVRRELEQLLNTRSPFPVHRLPPAERTVLDYGIPDFSMFSARRFADRQELAAMLRRAIEAFEPRLADVQVRLDMSADDSALMGHITATLVVDRVAGPVTFDLMINPAEGRIGVA